MADYSLDGIIEEINNRLLIYKQNKSANSRDNLWIVVSDGYRFINSNKAFSPDNKNDKFSKKVREELFPLVIEANYSLPMSSRIPIADLDYIDRTDFIMYLPKSYLEYIPKTQIKNVKVKQVFSSDKPYPINPYNTELQSVFENWLSKDGLRPVMQGIYFDEYGATGTDANSLLHLVGKKEGNWSYGIYKTDKQLNQDYKELLKDSGANESDMPFDVYSKHRRITDGKYPNYIAVSDINNSEVFTSLDCQTMLDVCKTIADNRLVNNSNYTLLIRVGDKLAGFNVLLLEKTFRTWLELGVDKVDMWNMKGDDYSKRAFVFTKKDEVKDGYVNNQEDISYSLLMPSFIIWGNEDRDNNTFINVIDENNIDVIVGGSPAYRFGTNKENTPKNDLEALISDLEMSMEYMTAKDKKNAIELISDLKLANQFA
jgi:hypothetical protein